MRIHVSEIILGFAVGGVWDADPRAARAALRPRHPAQPDGAQAKNKNQTYYGRRRSFFDQQNFFNHKINF